MKISTSVPKYNWLMAMFISIIIYGNLCLLPAMDDMTTDQKITDATLTPTPDVIRGALSILYDDATIESGHRKDLFGMVLNAAQDRVKDQLFIDETILKLFRSNEFRGLDISKQSSLANSILIGEGCANRKNHFQNIKYARDLAVELLRWIERIDAKVNPHFDPDVRPSRNPFPPIGYASGVSPEDVSDPTQRAVYERQWNENRAAVVLYSQQSRLRDERRHSLEIVTEHLARLTSTKEAAKTLRQQCLASGISAALINEVFDPPKESPVPPR